MAEPPVVQNNGLQRRLGGVTGKGFVPGQTGNPGGRPKAIAVMVQEILKRTHDGKDLVDWAYRIWRGEVKPLGRKPLPQERFLALQWMTERGWGRAPVQIDVTAPSVIIVTAQGDVE